MTSIAVFKLHQEAIIPQYATESAACFDIHACIKDNSPIVIYSDISGAQSQTPSTLFNTVVLPPGGRALIKTGLIFDIPVGFSLRLHARSGLSLKHGITLMNGEGIIDEDYVDELGIILYNSSRKCFELKHGDRICQAEIIKDVRAEITELNVRPSKKTDRSGGFGSTGK